MRVWNIFGTKFRGQIGKDMIASSWRGQPYLKEYVRPTDPKTEFQLKHRAHYAAAVKTWKKLSSAQKEFYGAIGDRLPGYQTFVSRYVRAAREEKVPEIPVRISWTREEDGPLDDCFLIVKQGRRQLFARNLGKPGDDVALTESDAPYTFVIAKMSRKEVVLRLDSLTEENFPCSLKSRLLNISLMLTVKRKTSEG